MKKETVILIAEDDRGHFELIKRNLWRNCVDNDILQFKNGQEVLDFLFRTGDGLKREQTGSYILLLDIRMPKVDGHEVLEKIRADDQLRRIPVIMLTTTDQKSEVDRCYELGCSLFMVKPTDYNKFMEAVEHLGAFLSAEAVTVPEVS